MGGIQTVEHDIEYIMAGAGAAGIGSEILIKGYDVVSECVAGIDDWFKKHDITDIEQIRGATLRYLKSFEEIKDNTQGVIRITLKYDEKGTRVIDGLKRISKPGLKVYAGKEELPKVLNGLGIAIISTSKGLMTDKEARNAGIGGEVLAYIW